MKHLGLAFFLALLARVGEGWDLSNQDVTKENLEVLATQGVKFYTESGLEFDEAKTTARRAIEAKLSPLCEVNSGFGLTKEKVPKKLNLDPDSEGTPNSCKFIDPEMKGHIKSAFEGVRPAQTQPTIDNVTDNDKSKQPPREPSSPIIAPVPTGGNTIAKPQANELASSPAKPATSGAAPQNPKTGTVGSPSSSNISQTPPSFGPLSPTPGEPSGAETPVGMGHNGGFSFSAFSEGPASSKKSSATDETPSAKKTAFTTPAIIASNFSVAKEAMDERVASGVISPSVAEALLARLKPVLETEPNLVKALDSVHESIKQKSITSELAQSAPENLPNTKIESTPAPEPKASPSTSPLARSAGSPSKESAPPATAGEAALRTPLTAAALILASTAQLQKNEALSAEPKPPLLASAKKPGEKAESSLIVKSAGSLSTKGVQSTSYFPPLPSKAFSGTTGKTALEVPPKPKTAKVGGILASIVQLLAGSNLNDQSQLRAVSSLSGAGAQESQSVNAEANLALASLGSSGVELETEEYDQEFLAIGLGTFGTCFSAALFGFVFWYRKRPKKNVG